MAGLPYDALTAALDAWLAQHITSHARRARVRQAVDCLDDLRTAPYAHIEFATNVSSWPALPRVRFLRALRELRGEPAVRFDRIAARRDARVGRWVEVYWPGDERWYRGRVTTQVVGPLLRVFYEATSRKLMRTSACVSKTRTPTRTCWTSSGS